MNSKARVDVSVNPDGCKMKQTDAYKVIEGWTSILCYAKVSDNNI